MKPALFAALAFLGLGVAPAASAAAPDDFPAFLKRYEQYKDARSAILKGRHTARFSGVLKFYESNRDTGECPDGNRWLQCLISATATIYADPNDLGGRAYVLVLAGSQVLDREKGWLPQPQRNVYSGTIEPLGSTASFSIPIPSKQALSAACKDVDEGELVSIGVGYGAVMPMDMEFAQRLKVRSDAGQYQAPDFDPAKFLFTHAHVNGVLPKKYGEIARVACRPEN